MNFTTTELCEAAAGASAVIAGTDMNCGGLYKTALPNAEALGFLTEAEMVAICTTTDELRIKHDGFCV